MERNLFAEIFLHRKVFAAPENAEETKMDINNLSMVMAPNILRSEAGEPR